MYCPRYHLLFKTPDIISSTLCNLMHVFHSIVNVILFSVPLCLHCCNKENWGKASLYVFSLLLVQTFPVLVVCFHFQSDQIQYLNVINIFIGWFSFGINNTSLASLYCKNTLEIMPNTVILHCRLFLES